MKNIYKILEEIKNESSSNKKLEILKRYKDNELLKKVLVYTYEYSKNFYIKDYEESHCFFNDKDDIDPNKVFRVLDDLSNRIISGNEARAQLKETTHYLSMDSRQVLRKIIERDLNVGISVKSINKVFGKNFIKEIPYMRCKTYKDVHKINFPAIIQTKEDAAFSNINYENNNIFFLTRNGNEFFPSDLKYEFLEKCHEIGISDSSIHGELMVYKDGVPLDRKTSNGLLNSFIKREETRKRKLEEIERKKNNHNSFDKLTTDLLKLEHEWHETDVNMVAVIWDIVPLDDWKEGKCKIPYEERFEIVKRFESKHIKIVESQIVNSLDEALEFYSDKISRGLEGAVLKNLDGIWKNSDSGSYDLIKIKSENEADLKVVGFEYGEKGSEFEKGIGSLICESSDGKIKVNVGSGLSREERGFKRVDENNSSKGIELIAKFDPNCYIDKIATVKFNELICDRNGNYSLFLPRLVEIREDKTEADDFQKIKNL